MDDMGNFDISFLREKMLANLGGKAEAYPHRIEQRFPRILVRLVELWGRPEADTYLNGLLVADRADRQGFPDDVASELFRLSMIHGALPSGQAAPERGGWSSSEVASEVDDFFSRRSSR